MHDCGLAKGQLQGPKCDVAMEEAPLVDETQNLGLGDHLLGPLVGPVVEDVLSDLGCRVVRAEEELLSLSAHQDEAEVDLVSGNSGAHGEEVG